MCKLNYVRGRTWTRVATDNSVHVTPVPMDYLISYTAHPVNWHQYFRLLDQVVAHSCLDGMPANYIALASYLPDINALIG